MESTRPVPTMATPTSSSSVSTSTTMKLPVASTYHEPCSSTSSQVQWTLSDLVLLVRSTDRTTSSLVRVEQGTTGPKDTTQRVPNWWTLSLMLYARKLKAAIA